MVTDVLPIHWKPNTENVSELSHFNDHCICSTNNSSITIVLSLTFQKPVSAATPHKPSEVAGEAFPLDIIVTDLFITPCSLLYVAGINYYLNHLKNGKSLVSKRNS